MAEKDIQFRKIREIGEVIGDSFLFLKQEAQPLFRLTLIYVLPFVLIYAYIQVLVQQKLMGAIDMADPESIMANMGAFYKSLLIPMLFNVFVQSLYVGTVYSYIEVYVRKGKGNFTLEEVTPLLFSNSLMILGLNLILFIIILFGTMLCIIPGIYFANSLSLAMIAFIIEKKGMNYSLSRSWRLVNHDWWSTFGIIIVGLIIILAVGFIISLPTMIGGVSTSVMNMQDPASVKEFPDWYWILQGINTVVSSLLYIILYVFFAFQYFNLSERTKEV